MQTPAMLSQFLQGHFIGNLPVLQDVLNESFNEDGMIVLDIAQGGKGFTFTSKKILYNYAEAKKAWGENIPVAGDGKYGVRLL